MSDTPYLIVGLGNPGADYEATRHNVGHMAVERLAADLSAGSFQRNKRANAFVATGVTRASAAHATHTPGQTIKLLLAHLGSFMNTSGGPVAALLDYYHVTPGHLIVVHDDLDLPFGTLRLKSGGGHGGHNGLRDIIAATKTRDFARVRVGIDHPPGRQPVADYVLRPFSSTERRELPMLVSDAADAALALATDGLEPAQQRFHAPHDNRK
ncbi:aminoacyl-tRNA hydrolase [Pseudoclavibacter sp. 13-3]|uniref:aminoacyl-tRNA hydrolase n=1 Tax=Pseudoclavibacter sp. 13-3 TaxID=2901228 RepID=UPI001E3860A9|nr:aminoacyl-tRNA hydrolase [Pseudoclavibacter sp. 13-3]